MNLKKFLENQVNEMLKYKWVKGQKIGHDPGPEACEEWIKNYAAQYRKQYDELYNEILTEVYNEVLLQYDGFLDNEKLLELVELIVKIFTDKWIEEKREKPDNPHIDEL